jgi:hypothetical protein
MAIVNRTLDASEQRKVMEISLVATQLVNGATTPVAIVPYPSVLDAGEIVMFGISGAPQFSLAVSRFIPGAGSTSYIVAVGTSNIPLAYGTSGGWAMVLPASGSTLLQLQANDVLIVNQPGGASAAAVSAVIGLDIKPIQDSKIVFGQV